MAKATATKTPAPGNRLGKTKLGGWVRKATAETARDLAYWERVTLGEVLEIAIALLAQTREQEAGSPVPRRPRSRRRLRAGRPPKED